MSGLINTKMLDKESVEKVQSRHRLSKAFSRSFLVLGAVMLFASGAGQVAGWEYAVFLAILGAFFLFSGVLFNMMRRSLGNYVEARQSAENFGTK